MVDWSPREVKLLVADYLSMLSKELTGISYQKSAHRRALLPLLNNRSEGSIEFKYQNVSAVLIELGAAFIQGYRPKYNYQTILKDECVKQLQLEKINWEYKFELFADTVPEVPGTFDYTILLDTPPESRKELPKTKASEVGKPFKTNYLEREQKNLRIGNVGEKIALEYEKWRLIQAGRESLADKVEWVAEYDDGAGFDILSKNENGSDRYIEVKSTKLSKETPIFFSKTEFEFAQHSSRNYYLYRVFNLLKQPHLFTVEGDFDSFCRKEAVQFKGYF